MSQVVHKLIVQPKPGPQRFVVPGDAKFISADKQNTGIAVWYTHDTRSSLQDKTIEFVLILTGQQIDRHDNVFLATIQYEEEAIGHYVLHLFHRSP